MRELPRLVYVHGHPCWALVCGDPCCSHTGTLRIVLKDCQVWFKLFKKTKSLKICVKRITGGDCSPPRSGRAEQSVKLPLKWIWKRMGVRKVEGEMSVCLLSAHLAWTSQSRWWLTPVRPMVWELGSHHAVTGHWHQTPVKRRGSGVSRRSSSAWRTELTVSAHVPYVAQHLIDPTNSFTMETGAPLVHLTAFLSLQPSSSISASHPIIP